LNFPAVSWSRKFGGRKGQSHISLVSTKIGRRKIRLGPPRRRFFRSFIIKDWIAFASSSVRSRPYMRPKTPIGKEFLALLLHVPLSTFGSMAVSLVVVFPIDWLLKNARLDISSIGDLGPYNPAFWGLPFSLGILVNRFMGNRGACWVWVVGLVCCGTSQSSNILEILTF
jgi:hypothetical protein